MNEMELATEMRNNGLSILEGDLDARLGACTWAVKRCIPPRGLSDRTCMSNLARWLGEHCEDAEHKADYLLRQVIDFAIEASGPESRNPAAVFMSILKRELNYPN